MGITRKVFALDPNKESDWEIEACEYAPTDRDDLVASFDRMESSAHAASRAAAAQWAAVADAVEHARTVHEVYLDSTAQDPRGTTSERELLERAIIKDVAMWLDLSVTAASAMATRAVTLRERLPRMWSEFSRQGVITAGSAAVLADVVKGMPSHLDADFENIMLAQGRGLPPAKLRRLAVATRERFEKLTRQERFDVAAEGRKVAFEPLADGMAWLGLYGRADVLLRAKARIDANAERLAAVDGEARTLDQLRADVAGDILCATGAPHEVVPTVFVTVPVLRLAGIRREDAEAAGVDPAIATDGAASLDGYGLIDDDTARRLFAKAPSFARIATDPFHGIRLQLDRSSRRPSQAQRNWLRLRYGTCAEGGCNRPAGRCDIDHTTDWQFDGPTNDANLAPICESGHTIKHKTQFRYERDPDFGLRITSPTGRERSTDPPPF